MRNRIGLNAASYILCSLVPFISVVQLPLPTAFSTSLWVLYGNTNGKLFNLTMFYPMK